MIVPSPTNEQTNIAVLLSSLQISVPLNAVTLNFSQIAGTINPLGKSTSIKLSFPANCGTNDNVNSLPNGTLPGAYH